MDSKQCYESVSIKFQKECWYQHQNRLESVLPKSIDEWEEYYFKNVKSKDHMKIRAKNLYKDYGSYS